MLMLLFTHMLYTHIFTAVCRDLQLLHIKKLSDVNLGLEEINISRKLTKIEKYNKEFPKMSIEFSLSTFLCRANINF